MRLILAGILVLALSGCGWFSAGDGEGVAATALPYRADLSRGEDRRDVTVAVRAPEATVDAVRESARFPVTRYCLSTYGASEADWQMDPATGDWAVQRDGENLIFAARCTAR